jgi:hypothetical protein
MDPNTIWREMNERAQCGDLEGAVEMAQDLLACMVAEEGFTPDGVSEEVARDRAWAIILEGEARGVC